MIAKDRTRPGLPALTMPLLLALCLGVGWWAGRATAPAPEPTRADPPPAGTGRGPFGDGPGVTHNSEGLDVLEVDIAQSDVDRMVAARERAIARGIIVQGSDDLVPATVKLGNQTREARVRLKGDWLDHVATDKWSLRVEVRGDPLRGMSRFSIQSPTTRGVHWEWLMMQAARREGLIAPRNTFVHVKVNGRGSGIYYLEEHFTKELLEAQGRREAPIVRFREDTLWAAWLQHDIQPGKPLPPSAESAALMATAEPGAYDEGRQLRVAAMNQRLQRALERMRDLQRLEIGADPDAGARARLALDAVQAETLDAIFTTDKVGRWLALSSLLAARHGLVWHQLRFYHDPVLDRLEPVCFDTGASKGAVLEPFDHLPFLPRGAFDRSPACRAATFAALGRITQDAWIDAFVADVGPDLVRFVRALTEEGTGVPVAQLEQSALKTIAEGPALFGTVLKQQAARLRAIALPRDPVNLACRVIPGPEGDDTEQLVVEVDAWATTRAPVLLTGFRFSNGRVVTASSALPDGHDHLRLTDGRVILPTRAPLRFRFPVDARLARLRDIEKQKQKARGVTTPRKGEGLRIDALFAAGAAPDDVRTEPLRVRRFPAVTATGRPAAPSLLEALDRHPCLGYRRGADRLFLRPGTWDVEGDLIVPPGRTLHAGPGVTLRFAEGAVLLSEVPLAFVGERDRPVVLEPREGAASWAGLLVLEAQAASNLEHVVVRRAKAVERGGWQATGGVTFYRSDVNLRGVIIEDAFGEDALNLFGVEFEMTGCALRGGVSDLFDGDFVRGTVRDCAFSRSVEDGVDVSGSEVTVENCRFDGIGDKAFSVGEESHVTIRRCAVTSAAIGLACKDISTADIDGLEITAAQHFGVAVFVKKAEYGPAHVTATGLDVRRAGRQPFLVQTGCTLVRDGVEVATEDVDVAALYRQKILGK